MEGAVGRVIERLNRRRAEQEAESAAKAMPTTSNGSHKELVLSDVYGTEADLNNDALNNYPPGTTAQRQREYSERVAQQEAEHDRLVAEGTDNVVAWYLAYGYSKERAESAATSWKREQRSSSNRHSAHNWNSRDEAHSRKINSRAYRDGKVVGETIGLDEQVGSADTKRLGR